MLTTSIVDRLKEKTLTETLTHTHARTHANIRPCNFHTM